MWDVASLIFGAIVGAILSQATEIFLPERVRIWFTLRKKTLSKWIRNPSYTMGITAALDCKAPLNLEIAKKQIQDLPFAAATTTVGTELHFQEVVGHGQVNTKIQFAYDPMGDAAEGEVSLYGIHVTAEAQTQYRHLRNRIEDLRAAVAKVEDALVQRLPVFPAKRELYVEVDRLAEFSEWLENLEAQQITGKIKGANAEFAYYGRRLVIADTINSVTIQWFKNIVAHVG